MTINLEAIAQTIKIKNFQKTELLATALTHPSYIYSNHQLNRQQKTRQELEYRRLAILGDSILNSVVIDHLHQQEPALTPGEITRLKSQLVSRTQACKFAEKVSLPELCLQGNSTKNKNIPQHKLENKIEMFGEMFEALLGAIYLEFDRNLHKTRKWLVKYFIADATVAIMQEIPVNTDQFLLEDTLEIFTKLDTERAIAKLTSMEKALNEMIKSSPKLQQLTYWIAQQTAHIPSYYEKVKMQNFYLAFIRIFALSFVEKFAPERGAGKARQFLSCLWRSPNIALNIAFYHNHNLDPACVLIPLFALNLQPDWQNFLQQLQKAAPHPNDQRSEFEAWRQTNGEQWLTKFQELINFDLQFEPAEKNLLKEYYQNYQLFQQSLVTWQNQGNIST